MTPDKNHELTIEATVIIPARDAARLLGPCLRSVFENRGVGYEVIVVDDASTDATGTVARAFPCRLVTMAQPVFAANARNIGARHARGDILVFLDADELAPPDTVARFAQALRAHPEVDAVVGSLTADTPVPGFFSRLKNFQHHFTHQTAATEGATLDSGRMAVRRRVFEQLGGFEPAFGGASIEDIALGYRMHRRGHRIRFEPSIQVVHLKSYTLAQMVRSDVLHRAVPWTGLMLRERMFRSDLNTRNSNVASVAAAWLLPPALLAGFSGWSAGWLIAGAALALITLLNRAFLAVAARALGGTFAVRAALFLPWMYLYQGVGLLLGVLAFVTGRSVARKRSSRVADYRILEPEREPDGLAGGEPT